METNACHGLKRLKMPDLLKKGKYAVISNQPTSKLVLYILVAPLVEQGTNINIFDKSIYSINVFRPA